MTTVAIIITSIIVISSSSSSNNMFMFGLRACAEYVRLYIMMPVARTRRLKSSGLADDDPGLSEAPRESIHRLQSTTTKRKKTNNNQLTTHMMMMMTTIIVMTTIL